MMKQKNNFQCCFKSENVIIFLSFFHYFYFAILCTTFAYFRTVLLISTDSMEHLLFIRIKKLTGQNTN